MTLSLQLTSSRTGRILLHLACIVLEAACIARPGRVQWHLQGIVREVNLLAMCRLAFLGCCL